MEELDVVELLYAFKKRVLYIVITVVVFALCGLIYSKFFITPMYKASTTFVLSKTTTTIVTNGDSVETTTNTAIKSSDITLNSSLSSTYSEIIKSRTTARKVIEALGLEMSEGSLISNVSVKTVSNSGLLEISVSHIDGEMAAKIANCITEVFAEKVKAMYELDNLIVIDEAEPAYAPYNISTTKNIAIFAVIGLVLICGIIFVIVYFDDSVKDEKDVEALLGVPVIATIPKMDDGKKGGFLKWKKAK